MGGITSYLSLLIILNIFLAINNYSCVRARSKIHVHVINGLTANDLHVHCYSKDNDLGQHLLAVSEHLDWSFRTSIFGTTRFSCEMNWAQGHGVFKVFWQGPGLQRKCDYKDCIWVVADDGLHLKDFGTNKFVFMYPWEK
ncbi:S-protein homolog 74-like [Mercurialis annua]|uniref:S-protein homolog 74-like n=1 Tax=Mercurialis annua TaxID=3986 RepID=UPI0024AD8C0D|nr:S-protein homolog 74-like [Mercurialis annua]